MFRHHTPILTMLALLLCVVPANAQVSPDDLAEGARERTRDRVQVAEEGLWTRSLIRRFENRVEETADLFATLERRNASLQPPQRTHSLGRYQERRQGNWYRCFRYCTH